MFGFIPVELSTDYAQSQTLFTIGEINSSPVDETVTRYIVNVVHHCPDPYIFLDVLKKISLSCSELYNYHRNKFMNILQWAVKLSWKQIRLIIFRHMVPFNASYLEIKVPLYGHEKLVLSFFLDKWYVFFWFHSNMWIFEFRYCFAEKMKLREF
jgi:hypothetical protein